MNCICIWAMAGDGCPGSWLGQIGVRGGSGSGRLFRLLLISSLSTLASAITCLHLQARPSHSPAYRRTDCTSCPAPWPHALALALRPCPVPLPRACAPPCFARPTLVPPYVAYPTCLAYGHAHPILPSTHPHIPSSHPRCLSHISQRLLLRARRMALASRPD